MPKDLNPANRLFGGQMMAWIDEAAAMFAICQAKNRNLVTAKVSEVNFTEPVEQGDFLIFEAEMLKVGRSSFTIGIHVLKKVVSPLNYLYDTEVCNCTLTFVTIDPDNGRSVPHGIKQEEYEKVS